MENNQISIQYWQSPLGALILGAFQEQLYLCDWQYRKRRATIDQRIQLALNATFIEVSHPVIEVAISQLTEYFEGVRKVFDVPYQLVGNDFQITIWHLLASIPYGKTLSYKDLSLAFGNVNSVRAVASANGANALSILIPCHRVIGSNQQLYGYAGGLEAKQKLLQIEGALNKDQLKLF